MRRFVRILGLGLLSAMLVGAPVNAGKPVMERQDIDETFPDDFLTEVCGALVTTQITGHATFRVFLDADENPVRELNNFALAYTFTSANGTLRVRDVGADRVTHLSDGSIILVILGNVQSINIPGQGRVYADVGQTTFHITFDANGANFEMLSQHGQHDADAIEALCSVLG